MNKEQLSTQVIAKISLRQLMLHTFVALLLMSERK